MVQLKYFGDSRDYFKYDLITFLLKNGGAENYVFIPMLTNHRIGNEGNKSPKPVEGKSKKLLSYIGNCSSKDLNHWETWLGSYAKTYKTVQPVNETFFEDAERSEYWKLFSNFLTGKNSLIFVDPDTGLETGKPSYLKKTGREKYILNGETAFLYQMFDVSSILMIYQHLPNNKHIHKEAVEKKIAQASSSTGSNFICSYREDDLAFIFIVKNIRIFDSLLKLIKEYHTVSGHKFKSIHRSPNNAMHSDGQGRGVLSFKQDSVFNCL